MKTIKIIIIGFFFLSIFTKCGQTPEEIKAENKQLYASVLAQFKEDSLDIVKQKFEQLAYFNAAFESISNIIPPTTHKEIKLLIEDEFPSLEFNTIYIHKNYFSQSYNHDFPISGYENLYNINRLINGEDLVFWGDVEEDKRAIIRLNEFRQYCNKFIATKYVVIIDGRGVKMPKVTGTIYEQGIYNGICAVYDFQGKKLLDNFLFSATNANDITAPMDSYEKIVLQDLFNQTKIAIYHELNKRYVFLGSLPTQTIKEGIKLNL